MSHDPAMELYRSQRRTRKSRKDDVSGPGSGGLKFLVTVILGYVLTYDWHTVDGLALALGVLIGLTLKLTPMWRARSARLRQVARAVAVAETAKVRATAAELGLEWVDPETGLIENSRYGDGNG